LNSTAIEAPIFIVGAPRSGTTLTRNFLSRHPRIFICGETHFIVTSTGVAGHLAICAIRRTGGGLLRRTWLSAVCGDS
jgi:hypothetical protein